LGANFFSFGAQMSQPEFSIDDAIARNKRQAPDNGRANFVPRQTFTPRVPRVDYQKPISKQVGNKRHAQEASQSDVEVQKRVADLSKSKFCFRCFTKGHDRSKCEASVFCEICESKEHVK